MAEDAQRKRSPAVLELPDYVFSRLIEAFRKIKPQEGLGVLYGDYVREGGREKVRAEKIWLPPMKYLESTPTGVKLTEMGKKYHSSVDHFEILSDSSPIAWVHSHPIEHPSEIDKTTQTIAQLFKVPLGVFVNYGKLDTPKDAVKAFKVSKGQEVQLVPIRIVRTDTLVPPHQVKIEIPEFKGLKEKSAELINSYEEYLSSIGNTFQEVVKASAVGDQKLSNQLAGLKTTLKDQVERVLQRVNEKHMETERKLQETNKRITKEFQALEKDFHSWRERVWEKMKENHRIIREKVKELGEELKAERKASSRQMENLKRSVFNELEGLATTQEKTLNLTKQIIENVNEMKESNERTKEEITEMWGEHEDEFRTLLERIAEIKKRGVKHTEQLKEIPQKIEANIESQLSQKWEEVKEQRKDILSILEREVRSINETNKEIEKLKGKIKDLLETVQRSSSNAQE